METNSYANYLKGKCLEASIKNETAILSSQLKEELDNYNKDKRVKGSLRNLKILYAEKQFKNLKRLYEED